MSTIDRIVLVGHCGPDSWMLKSAVSNVAGGVPVESVNDQAAVQRLAAPSVLFLVNRVLDGQFAAGDGVELISGLAKSDDPPVTMLVSNFEQVQRDAEAAGARPGFGKSELGTGVAQARLEAVLNQVSA